MKTIRQCFSRIGLAYTVFMVVSALSQVGAMLLLWHYPGRISYDIMMVIYMLSMYPLSLLCLWLLLRKLPKARQTWRVRMGAGAFILAFIVCIGAMYAGNLLGEFFTVLLSLIRHTYVSNIVEDFVYSIKPWTLILTAVIVAPVMEELIYRKMMLDRIAGYGPGPAILFSGLMFGLAHGNFGQFFYAFALGVIFAWIYLRTGKIRYSIALHMLINFWGSVLPMYLSRMAMMRRTIGPFLLMGQEMFTYACMAVALIVVIWQSGNIGRYLRSGSGDMKVYPAMFLNAGMILFFVLCGVQFLAL